MKAYDTPNKVVLDKLYNDFTTQPDAFTSASFEIFDASETLYK